MESTFAGSSKWLFLVPVLLTAQGVPTSTVPRASGGKPDLTSDWQGASTRRGSWEEANSGFGVGAAGQDPTAPANPSTSVSTAAEPSPYQLWAAKKVLESFSRRGIDNPTAPCLPPGVPRSGIMALFATQIVQTPQQVVIIYKYMSVFRVIPSKTIVSKDKLVAEMAEVRRQGYAAAEEEKYTGVRSWGAPIYDGAREVRAAVALNGSLTEPAWNDTPALVKLIREAAAEISKRPRFS